MNYMKYLTKKIDNIVVVVVIVIWGHFVNDILKKNNFFTAVTTFKKTLKLI